MVGGCPQLLPDGDLAERVGPSLGDHILLTFLFPASPQEAFG